MTEIKQFSKPFQAIMSAKDFNKLVEKGGTGKKKITPESAEKKAIKDYLNAMGWYHYPNTAGFGSKRGIPDITALKNGVVVQIEVKAPGGKQSPGQAEFEADWTGCGGTYVLGGIDAVMKVCR